MGTCWQACSQLSQKRVCCWMVWMALLVCMTGYCLALCSASCCWSASSPQIWCQPPTFCLSYKRSLFATPAHFTHFTASFNDFIYFSGAPLRPDTWTGIWIFFCYRYSNFARQDNPETMNLLRITEGAASVRRVCYAAVVCSETITKLWQCAPKVGVSISELQSKVRL